MTLGFGQCTLVVNPSSIRRKWRWSRLRLRFEGKLGHLKPVFRMNFRKSCPLASRHKVALQHPSTRKYQLVECELLGLREVKISGGVGYPEAVAHLRVAGLSDTAGLPIAEPDAANALCGGRRNPTLSGERPGGSTDRSKDSPKGRQPVSLGQTWLGTHPHAASSINEATDPFARTRSSPPVRVSHIALHGGSRARCAAVPV